MEQRRDAAPYEVGTLVFSGVPAAVLPALPEELAQAITRYETALLHDDQALLSASFADGGATLRGDEHGLVAGASAIRSLLPDRTAPHRRIVRMEARAIDSDAYLLVSVTAFANGGRGLETQLWQRDLLGWRIRAVQVAPQPQAVDPTIWQVVGAPLVPSPVASGPLAGRRVAVNDLFAVRGQPIGAGNPQFRSEAALERRHAAAVQSLLDAGADIRGITQTDEFGYAIAGSNVHYGTPPNPAAPDRVSGGASSGSAAAVALGMADIGLGTDTCGTIRVPASYEGLWGVRTSHGLVERAGILPLSEHFDAIGWLTRDAQLLGEVASALIPNATADIDESGPLVLIGLEDLVEPAAQLTYAAGIERLERALGRTLPRIHLDRLAEAQQAVSVMIGAQAWHHHGDWVRRHPQAIAPPILARFRRASRTTRAQERVAGRALASLRDWLDGVLADRILLLPTTSGPAPRRDLGEAVLMRGRAGTLQLQAIAGVTGRPEVSAPAIPIGELPLGLSAIGPAGSDRRLITWAARHLSVCPTIP